MVKSNKSFFVSLQQAGYFHHIEPFQFAVSDPIAGKKHKYLEDILINGGSKANDIAEPIIKKTKNIVGFF